MSAPKLSKYLHIEFLSRKLNLWRAASLVMLLVLIYTTYKFDDSTRGGSDYIARIKVEGFINNDEYRLSKLSDIAKDKSVKAVIVDIDSPGGSVVGGELLYESLKALSDKIPTVVFVGSQATSAAYMAAIGCDYIVSPQGALIGSIGVVLQSVDVSNLAKTLGIEPVIIKSTALKAVPHFAEKLTEEGEASLKEVIDDIYKMFIDMVLENRSLDPNNVDEVVSGKVFSGNRAYELGLIDEVGGFDAVRKYLATKGVPEDVKIKQVSLKKDDMSPFLKILTPVYKIVQENLKILSVF